MSSLHVPVLAGALALAVAAAPDRATAQCPALRRGEHPPTPPSAQAPRVLVPIFRGDPNATVPFATYMRDRIGMLFDAKQLWVITCYDQDTVMVRSGYPPDAALATPTDLPTLGRLTRATESIDGDLDKGPDGQFHVVAHMYYENNMNIHEVISASDKSIDALANKVAEAYKTERRELEPYSKCNNFSRDRKGDSAVAYAKLARAAYPDGMLWRACLMNALSVQPNASPDSIVAAAQAVLATDSLNRRAVGIIADAMWAKGDSVGARPWYIKFYDLDQSNVDEAQAVIARLELSGAPDQALPIVDQVLKRNPSNSDLRKTQLRIQLHLHHYKEAYVAFDELVKADTAQGSRANYAIMIGAAQADSNPQMVLEYLGRVTQRVPDDATLWMDYSVHLRDAGQLQQAVEAARRAIKTDPKVPQGYAWLFQLYANLDQPDSTLVFAKQALAAGADSTVVDNAILRILAPVFSKAQTDSSGQSWQPALTLSVRVDSIRSSDATNYYIGVASFSLAQSKMDAVAQLSKTDKPRACQELGTIFDLANQSYDAMATHRGGRRDPTHAQVIVLAVPQVRAWVARSKAALSTGGFTCA